MSCCGDGVYLLDADQNVPDYVDEIFFRFRIYHEVFTEQHAALGHVEGSGNGCDSGWIGATPSNHSCKHIEFDIESGQDVRAFQSTFEAGWMLGECEPEDAQCAG